MTFIAQMDGLICVRNTRTHITHTRKIHTFTEEEEKIAMQTNRHVPISLSLSSWNEHK